MAHHLDLNLRQNDKSDLDMTTAGSNRTMTFLFCHKTFPGQFGGIASYLAAQGHKIYFLTCDVRFKDAAKVPKVPWADICFVAEGKASDTNAHRFLGRTNDALELAERFFRVAMSLHQAGVAPDLICAHSGWGVGTFMQAVWPDAVTVPYVEWWYRFPARDTDLTEDDPNAGLRRAYARARNLPFLLDIQDCDCVLTPTRFQAAEHPDFIRDRTVVMHDGVDCQLFSPGPAEKWSPAAALSIPPSAPILTYATRGMEPVRGFPDFMAALEKIQARNPDVHTVIAGNDSVHYGNKPKGYDGWKEKALADHALDLERIHFVGKLPLTQYRDLLRASTVHVAFSTPFILSWSVIHAMATGCTMVVSENDMMREALPSDDMAVYVNHKDSSAVMTAVCCLLDNPDRRAAVSKAARERALDAYDERTIHPEKEKLFLRLLDAKRPEHGALNNRPQVPLHP